MGPDDSVPAVNEVSHDLVFLRVPFQVDDQVVVHHSKVFQVFSTKFEIVLESVINFVETLVFTMESGDFLSALFDLIDSHPENILSLPDILR